MKRILLPVDLSLESQKALRYGCALGRQFKAMVTLLHIVPDVLPASLSHLALVYHTQTEAREARRKLARWRRAVASSGWRLRTVVRTGNPAEDICRFARTDRSDLVVLSTHGYSGAKRLWLGSITERVVRLATCPVLVVRMRERDFVPLSEFNP